MKIKMLKSVMGAWDGISLQQFVAGKFYDVPEDMAPRSLELAAMFVRVGMAVETDEAAEAAALKVEADAKAAAEAKKKADAEAKAKAKAEEKLAKAKKLLDDAKKPAPAKPDPVIPDPKSTAPQG